MKRALLVFLFILTALSQNLSQNSNINNAVLNNQNYIIDSIVTISEEIYKTKYIYTRNTNNEISQILRKKLGPWENIYKWQYFYEQEKKTIMEKMFWENDGWHVGTREYYSYDYNGNLSSVIHEEYVGTTNNLNIKWRKNYTYNSSNQKILMEYDLWHLNNWKNADREIYDYNSVGETILIRNERSYGSIWDLYLELKYEYIYDLNNFLISFKKEQWLGGKTYKDRWTYTNNLEGKKIIEIYEHSEDSIWSIVSKGNYEYDSNGNLSELTRENWSNDQWVFI